MDLDSRALEVVTFFALSTHSFTYVLPYVPQAPGRQTGWPLQTKASDFSCHQVSTVTLQPLVTDRVTLGQDEMVHENNL